MDQVHKGMQNFITDLQQDEEASDIVELSVIKFGGGVEVSVPFSCVRDLGHIPKPKPRGKTPAGEATVRAIERSEQRKREYKSQGLQYYRPWIVLLTDGRPTDAIDQASRLIAEGERDGHLLFWAAGTEDADFEVLKRLTHNYSPFKIEGTDFSGLFEFLGNSMSSVSRSGGPGTQVQIDNPADHGLTIVA